MIKVFQLDDIEWWAGESLEACIKAARAVCGAECYPGAEEEGSEVSEDDMRKLTVRDGDAATTFAEQVQFLIKSGTVFPCLFAAADY